MKAYLLGSKPYREKSYLLYIFTECSGVIQVLSVSKKHLGLNPFHLLNLEIKETRTFPRLLNCDYQHRSYNFFADKLISALYLNELLCKITIKEESSVVFANYESFMHELSEVNDPFPVVKKFEIELLRNMGFIDKFEVVEQSESLYVTKNSNQCVATKPNVAFFKVKKDIMDMVNNLELSSVKYRREIRNFIKWLIESYLELDLLNIRSFF